MKLPTTTFVKQREDHRFECKTTSAPSLKISWYKNDQLLTKGDKYKIVSADSTAYLQLRTTDVEDNGVYTCEAYNAAGNASCSTVLTVQGQTLNGTHLLTLHVGFCTYNLHDSGRVTICEVHILIKHLSPPYVHVYYLESLKHGTQHHIYDVSLCWKA